ncbi:MAG TPA: NADH-quinone oxidoreductase subunit J, partial [Acidimicrobiales bacterium]
TGTHSATAAISDNLSNIAQLGRQIFTTWIFAFEITAGLLTIAVIGAVVLSRRPDSYEPIPEPESMDDDTAEELA